MKKIILMFLVTSFAFAQEKFEFKKEGLTDYVVTNVNGTAAELFSKTVNWIKENYKNPNEVIKMTIENEKLRFQGLKEDFYCVKGGGSVMCSNAIYTIEVSFKDGKYRFDPIELVLRTKNGASSDINLNDFSVYFEKDGSINKRTKDVPGYFENLFNGLNESLKNYIENQTKKSDW